MPRVRPIGTKKRNLVSGPMGRFTFSVSDTGPGAVCGPKGKLGSL